MKGMGKKTKKKKVVICYLHGSNESIVTLFLPTGRFEKYPHQGSANGIGLLSLRAIFGGMGGC